MSKAKHPFKFNCTTGINTSEYLGTDGLPTEEIYNLYLRKCDQFKAKARRYAKENLSIKNSSLHQSRCGYNSTKELEEKVLKERMEFIKNYKTAFEVTFFYEDPNVMYECFSGKGKRIRIIRELHQERNEEFSSDFDKKKGSWFTRYCILSRFIQAARNIILLNRLKAALAIFKTLTPETIRKIQTEGDQESDNISEQFELEEKSEMKILPCVCD